MDSTQSYCLYYWSQSFNSPKACSFPYLLLLGWGFYFIGIPKRKKKQLCFLFCKFRHCVLCSLSKDFIFHTGQCYSYKVHWAQLAGYKAMLAGQPVQYARGWEKKGVPQTWIREGWEACLRLAPKWPWTAWKYNNKFIQYYRFYMWCYQLKYNIEIQDWNTMLIEIQLLIDMYDRFFL